MKYLIAGIIVFSMLFALYSCSKNEHIHIGTFNIEWLGDGKNDRIERKSSDYRRIASIIKDTQSDIICLQEIENATAMDSLVKYLDGFYYYVTNYDEHHNLAVLYKENVSINYFKTYYPLRINDDTRPGTIFNFTSDNMSISIMSVHLKSTSRYDSTASLRELSYKYRREQAVIINNWIDSVSLLNEMFIIAGDFNDNPKRKNSSVSSIFNNENAIFLTDGFKSCKYPIWDSIDHIIISKNLFGNFLAGSSRVYNFNNSLSDELSEKVSDHCPVIASFVF